MQVPMLDLKPQYEKIKDDIQREIAELCASQMFILGPKVEAFEQQAAAYCGARFACAVSSGSDALLMALMVEGIGPGDTSDHLLHLRHRRSHAQAQRRSLRTLTRPTTLNPALVEALVTPKTEPSSPVHLYGQPTDMGPHPRHRAARLIVIGTPPRPSGRIQESAHRRHRRLWLPVLLPSKNLGEFGGLQLPRTSRKTGHLPHHGMMPRYHHRFIGVIMDAPGRCFERQAQARRLDARRQQNANDTTFSNELVLQPSRPTTRHVRNQYVVRSRRLPAPAIQTDQEAPYLDVYSHPCIGSHATSLGTARRFPKAARRRRDHRHSHLS